MKVMIIIMIILFMTGNTNIAMRQANKSIKRATKRITKKIPKNSNIKIGKALAKKTSKLLQGEK